MTSVRTFTSRIRMRRRKSLLRRVFVLGGVGLAVFAVLFASAPTAKGYSISNTNEISTTTGGGGYVGPANCPTGSVLYQVGSGGNINWSSLTLPTGICADLNAAATVHNSVTGALSTSGWGGASNYALTDVRCSSSQAIVGLVVHKQGNGYASGWQLMCGTLPDGGSRSTSPTVFGWSNAGTSSPTQRETIQCPTGMVAVGMVAWVGSIMDRIGLRCGTITGAEQATVTMSSSSTLTYGTSMTVTANGGTGTGGISYSATGSCSLSGSTLTATGNAGSTCSVTATRAANANYAAKASSAQTVTITRAANTISFTNPGTRTWTATPFNVTTSATSGITPSITSTTPSVCSASGIAVTMLSSGTCSLTASQGETTNHVAAVAVVQSFTINPTGRSAFSGNSATISATTTGTKYVVERFTTTGTSTWTVPQGVSSIDYLVVGGGAGGGSRHAGGGGAGGVRSSVASTGGGASPESAMTVTPGGSLTVTVGAGGASWSNGSNSVLGNVTSIGGGTQTTAGGSGGGSNWNGTAGTGTANQGFNGGRGGGNDGDANWLYAGGGGGGAGSVGSNVGYSGGTAFGGAGGAGITNSITGTASCYAGGGGGGYSNQATNGGADNFTIQGGKCGSTMVGGTSPRGANATAGAANTGSGGGGGGFDGGAGNYAGGAGGSGIVVVRYVLPTPSTPDLSSGFDSGTSSTDNVTTNRTLTFTGSAPITSTVQLSIATASSASDTDATTGTWTNTGLTCTTSSTTGQWSCDTAQLAPGLYKVRSTATTAMDGLTDTTTSSTALVINIDTTAPTVSLTRSGTGALTAGQTETITFTLSEASSNFAADDITFSGGTISALTTTSSTVYSVVFTPTVNTNSGTASISVAGTRFTDAAGNNNTASSTTSISYDTSRPTISLSGCAASYASGTTCSITITLSDSVSDLVLSDFTVSRGSLSGLTTTGTSRTVTYTATGPIAGTSAISVAAGAITDANGNTNIASNTLSVTVASSNARQMMTSLSATGVSVADNTNGASRYIVQTFAATGSTTWTAPNGVTRVDLLVVGGGGGAGSRGAGGGGAGGYIEASNYTVTPGSAYSVVVGAGGAGAAAATQDSGAAGSASSFTLSSVGLTANGGGAGQSHSFYGTGGASGTGSGAGGTSFNTAGGNGAAFASCGSTSDWCGGGGGGASTAGAAAVNSGGNGGAGRASSITGTSITFAGGGGGGGGDSSDPSNSPSPGGNGGTGGGGNGGSPTWNGTSCTAGPGISGTVNTGGGGGGGAYCSGTQVSGNYNGGGGSGGSGIVVVRYLLPAPSAPDLDSGSDTGSSSTDNLTRNQTLTFAGNAPVTASVQLSVATASSASDTNATTGTWTDTGAACTANTTSGAWTCSTASLAPGLYKVRSTATTTLDGITDTQTSSTALVVDIDTSAPTVTLTRAGSALLTVGQTETITFTLSEASSSFAADDITVAGGSIGTLTTTSSTVYSAVFTPTTNTNSGTGTLSVVSSRFTDTAGNNNSASSTTSITYDTARPTVLMSASPPSTTSGSTTTLTFTVSESTTTFTSADVSATLGTLTGFSGSGTTYTATFTASPSTGGTAIITVASGSITDANTNANTTAFTFDFTVTNTASSSGGRTSYLANGTNGTNGVRYFVERFTTTGAATWTVPQGVTSVDVLAIGGGGGAGDNSGGGGSGGGVSYQTGVAVSGTVNLSVGAGGAAGTSNTDNGKNGSATSFGAISAGGGNGGRSDSTGRTGGASVTGSGAGGNGSSSASVAGQPGGNGPSYSITGTPTNYAGGGGGGGWVNDQSGGAGGSGGGGAGGGLNGPSGTNGVAGTNGLGGGGGSGSTGASTAGAGGSGIVVVRYAVPNVSTPDLDSADDTGTNTDNITSATTLTLTGSAPVGSTVQLFVDGVASGSTCTTNSSTGTWSCDTAVLTAGDKVITAESRTVLSDSTVTSTSSGLTVTIDTTAPTITLTRAGSGLLTVGQTETITFTLSEASSNFTADDITVTGGSIGTLTTTSSTLYSAVFTPSANTNSGTGTLSVVTSRFTDTAGNNNTASSTTSITYDTGAPTVSMSASPSSVSSGSTTTVTFTVSESTTTFTSTDVSATLGTLTGFTGSGTTYTATFTASPSTGGTAVITVASGSITDANTNANTSAFIFNITVTNTTSSSGGRTNYRANGTNGTNNVRYFVEQFTTVGTTSWTAPQGVTSVEYLVVAGGGGGAGGHGTAHGAGGGGAGGYRTNATGQSSGGASSAEAALSVTPGTSYSVVVGAGGNGGAVRNAGSVGNNSQFASIIALGGGGGGSYYAGPTTGSAGSGGGAGAADTLITGANGTSGQGFKGGNTPTENFTTNGAGGGGSGGVGGNGVHNGATAAGGIGTSSTITGTSAVRAAGGSGGTGTTSAAGASAASNTGSGGGGGSAVSNVEGVGGNGASGTVIIRYAVPDVSTPDLDSADDTGTNTDNITSATTLTLTGSAPVGSTVQLFVDGVASGSTCISNSSTGAWSCDTAVLTEGNRIITAESTTILSDSTVVSTSTGLTVTIDTTSPTVSSVSFTSSSGSDDTYKIGDVISATVTFSENVTVTNSPRITLTGLSSKFATYASGSGTSSLVFTYTVVSGDTDTDGLAITADSLSLNSGTIRDTAANNATLTHSAVATQSAHKVDGVVPTVTITRAGSGSLKSGQTDTITFTLSESASDFVAGDISTTGGALSTLTGSGTTYTATFTPTANTSGTASISVGVGAFSDPVGNLNAVDNSLTVAYDTGVLLARYDAAKSSSYAGTGATVWNDLSGNGRNATLVGSPALIAATSSAARLISLPTSSSGTLHNRDFSNFSGGITVQATLNFGNVDTWERIVDFGRDANGGSLMPGDAAQYDNVFWSRDTATNNLLFVMLNGSTEIARCSASGAILNNTVANYAVTLSFGGSCQMYRNGTALTTTTSITYNTRQNIVTRNSNFIGRSNWTADGDLNGSFRSLYIYNRALSASEVLSNYDTERQFTISYDANNASSGTAPSSGTYTTTSFISAGAATVVSANTGTLERTGLGFGGWNTEADGSGTNYVAGTSAYQTASDITLYAQWNDITAPTVSTTTASIRNTQSATGQSTETGTLYLVNTSVSVSNLSSITSAAGALWNSASVTSANTDTTISAAGLSDGTYRIYAVDASSNLSSASTNSITIDTTAPTVTIARAGSESLKSGQTEIMTFTLSEASSNFAVGDITVSGGSIGTLTTISSTEYSAVFTPTANTNSGTGSLSVAGATFTDIASNNNTASTTLSINYDTAAPTITVTRAGSTALRSGQTDTITFTLSEASSNFAVDDITVSGGSIGTLTTTSSTVYSAVFTPTTNKNSGTGSISVSGATFTDSIGNDNTASTTLSISYDTAAPTVTITRAGSGSLKSGQTETITFTLSETSTNFVATDVTTTGGSIGSLSGSGTSYTATFTPTTNTQTGTGSISVAGATFTDALGNDNAASTALSISYDTAAPTVTITRAGSGSLKSGQTEIVTFTLSEASSDFAAGDITISGGSIGTLTTISSTEYSAVFTPTANINSGTGSLSVAGATFTDATGNDNTASSTLSINYDTLAPTVTVSRSVPGSIGVRQNNTITFTLSEASSTFTAADITVTDGSIGTLTTVSSTVYRVLFTPTADTESGTGTLSVDAAKFTDSLGNDNTASNTLSIPFDTREPTVTITRAGSTTLRSGQTDTITFTLSEASNTFIGDDITVAGGSIGSLTTVSSTVYRVTFTPTANTQSGNGSISIAGAKFTDATGNGNIASSTRSVPYDTLSATISSVTSSTANGTIGIGSTASIQVLFSEIVSVTGIPQLTLETGTTDRTADYTSGSGTNTLTFTYTVQSGDTASDLDYASSNALALNGGTIVDAVNNNATLTLPAPGASGSLAASNAIVVASAPTKIVSVRLPSGTASGAAFTLQPQVSLQDTGGSVVTSDSSTVVTATVSTGAILVGTRDATAANGIVTFDNLGISGTAGTAYTITYSATVSGTALTVATQSVTPTVGAATKIAVSTQPVGDTAGALLSTFPSVSVLDSGNNVVTSATTSITVAPTGGTLGGTKTLNATNGVATFGDLTFAGTASTNYKLQFTTSNLGSVDSANFTVGVGAPTHLSIATNASGAKYNNDFTTQPAVEILDAGNNKVTTAANVVTAALSSGTVVGSNGSTLTATPSSGVATFDGLGITGLPGTYTITYSSGSLTGASQSISLAKADQTITFSAPTDRPWSSTAFAVTPTASSDLAVSLASTTNSICTVSTLDVTMVTVGFCSLTATQAGNDYFNAATSISRSFTISQASQSITFATPTDRAWSASTFTVAPTASSDLAVSLTSTTTAVCTVSSFTVTMVKAGTCTLSTAQSGNTKYLSATPVTRSFEISLADQAALSLTSTTATFGANLTLTTSGGSGTGDVSYIKVSGDCTVAGTTLTPTAAGSCDVTATKAADTQYASASVTQTVTIARANQSTPLTLSNTTVIYGQTLTLSASGGDGTGAISYAVSSGTCSLSGATLTPGDAGSLCEVVVTRALSANYNAQTSNPISITIQRATPTLGSLTLTRKTFGDAPFTLAAPSADYNSAAVAGTWTYISAQASVATINASTATVTGGGTSVLTATFTPDDSTNYVTAFTTSTLTVDKATPTFSWTNVGATYGDADISIVSPAVATTSATGTWTYSSADTSVVAIAGTKFDVLDAGTSVVTATFTPSNTTNFVTGGTITMTVTVDTANQVALVISSVTGTYGTDLTLTTTGGSTNGTITWGASNGTATGCAITSGKLTTTSAGNCEVTATMAGNSNYNPVANLGTTVTINAKPITVTAVAKFKTYGDNDPVLTFTTVNGALVGNDTLTGSLTRAAGNTVGEYTINQGTVTNTNNTNYDITYTSAKLTINAKPITVTAEPKNKIYGQNDPALTFTTAVGALENNDTLAGALARDPGNTVGEYTINQGTVTNTNNTNYDITYTTAKLTINTKPITVAAEPKFKTYGDNDPTLTFTTAVGALENNDTLTGSLTRTAGNTVGEYTINQGTVTNTNNTNYDITYTTAKLTINAKPITVTAEPKTKVFGDNDPALTYTTAVGALVGNDTFTGSLTRTAGEQVSSYPIGIGTLNNTNYLITFIDSALTITPAQQSQLTVTTTSITYQTPVLLQATGGTEGSLSFAVVSPGTAGCSIANGSLIATGNAGSTCTVTATRAATNNYQQKTSSAATITVTQRFITVTATAEEKTYGDVDPGFRYSVTTGSLHGSDSFTGSLGRTTGENVGTYDIDQGTLANANYSITFVPAQLTINRRPITITAEPKTKIFGQPDPALTYEVTTGNIVNSDAFTGSITRAVGETLGNYNITRGNLANGNYAISFVVGTFQITGAPQTGFSLTATSFSVVYQQTVTLSTTGGDGAGVVSYATQNGTGSCSLAGSTLTGATAGTCTVTATKAAEGGYLAATSNTITVTVDKADQAIVFAQIANRDFSPVAVVVSPTSTSGAQVALDSRTPNVCFTENLQIRMTDSGTCSIEAEIPESRNHNAAQTVVRSFEVRAVVPFAPTISSVEPGDAKVTIAFTPGLSGGASITTYRYSVDDGTRWTELPNGTISSPIVVGNLPNNVEARVRIMAVNRVGAGARSNMKVTTPISPRSLEWETQRSLTSSALPSSQPTVSSLANQLPPRPATVRIQSLQGGRRTQVTAVRAAKDANIPVTHALISIRTRTNKLLARIKVLVDPANPTTSVSVPYASSKVRVSVQFANDIGISDGGTAGVNIAEGNTFEWTTVNNETRIKGTQIKGDLFFARGKSTITYAMQQNLKKMAATAKARGGLIYVSGFAQKGELKSAWMLEPLARARAEAVSKYLAKIGVRQWITFHGTSNSAFNGWEPVSGRQVIITTVMPDET